MKNPDRNNTAARLRAPTVGFFGSLIHAGHDPLQILSEKPIEDWTDAFHTNTEFADGYTFKSEPGDRRNKSFHVVTYAGRGIPYAINLTGSVSYAKCDGKVYELKGGTLQMMFDDAARVWALIQKNPAARGVVMDVSVAYFFANDAKNQPQKYRMLNPKIQLPTVYVVNISAAIEAQFEYINRLCEITRRNVFALNSEKKERTTDISAGAFMRYQDRAAAARKPAAAKTKERSHGNG